MDARSESPIADRGIRRLPPSHWRGRRVTVMGLGTHGGGVGAVRFLAKHGARIRLTDLRSASDLSQPLSELRDVNFESVRLGWHDAADFRDADVVVVNPAVPCDHPILRNLRHGGVPIATEVGLLWQHTSAKVVAVTGSVGKSTTAGMIDCILRNAGRRSWLGGNIGGSLLHDIDLIGEGDWLVLELSSFQLAYLSEIGFRPEVGVVTNFSPNHLDWHRTLDHYRASKQQMFARQIPGDVAVIEGDDREMMNWPTRASVVTFGSADWLHLPQIHAGSLRRNASCAVAACLAMGVSSEAIVNGLDAFRPLPHRFEHLGTHGGRQWINDSKATTPAAALAAISSCGGRPWVLLGGADKQVDLSGFCASIAHEISGAALMGEVGPELQAHLRSANPSLPLRLCQSMSEAVNWTATAAKTGDSILLSPACSSLDQYRDYADRGEQFRDAVLRLDQSRAIAPAA